MALTRTDLHGSISGASGFFGTGGYTTGSFTPPDSSLLVVGIAAMRHTVGGDFSASLTVADSVGLTWTARKRVGDGADFGTGCAVFTAPVNTGVSMTVTVDCGAESLAWYVVSIIAYTGHDTGTPTAATGSVTKTAGFSTPEPATITLDAAPASTSEVFGTIAASKGTPLAIVNGTGYTELYDLSNTDWGDGESEVRAASTSTSFVWDDVRNTAAALFGYSAVAVEIKEGTAPAVPNIRIVSAARRLP